MFLRVRACVCFCKRIQEEDGGFFEKLGTRLAEKAQAQQLEETLPEEDGECGNGPSVEENLHAAEKREALYAAKESNLQRQTSFAEPTTIATTSSSDSESEEHETAYDIVAQSMGLNVSDERERKRLYCNSLPPPTFRGFHRDIPSTLRLRSSVVNPFSPLPLINNTL